MDRRDFFKTLFITPLLTPLLLASKTSTGDAELYMITDSPQRFLPPLLEELRVLGIISGRTYSTLHTNPQEYDLDLTLAQAGWTKASEAPHASLSISSSLLQSSACPSFTLARDGRVWDIRTQKLLSLWSKMKLGTPSTRLTIVTFKKMSSKHMPGEYASLYKDGRKVKTLSLKQNATRSFRTKGGQITVKVENGRAWIAESSCAQKICVHCPPASFSGERIICAPNHFLLEIIGPSSVDTIIG